MNYNLALVLVHKWK